LAGGPAFDILISFSELKLWVPRPCVFAFSGNEHAGIEDYSH